MATPTFHDILRRHFVDATPHVAACGMQITRLDASGAEVRLPFREDWIGDAERGLIHPGIVTTLVDSACGAAVMARIERLEPIATLDLRMDYLRAGRRGLDVHCLAQCYRLTASIAFARATVWQDDRSEPIAVSQSVFMRTQRRPAPEAPR
ncbi:PaaI family thioesterase [Fontimonas sp. SYSU GA230001]|uniref:PaaI family thioesterase n=1 Tax=Fontimonas sp. SYSU GA230001 TaxID=3142450 RepID=UPI0032B565EE